MRKELGHLTLYIYKEKTQNSRYWEVFMNTVDPLALKILLLFACRIIEDMEERQERIHDYFESTKRQRQLIQGGNSVMSATIILTLSDGYLRRI